MATPPIFVDASGYTARVNAPTSPTAFIHLSFMTPTEWEETRVVQPARTFDMWISREDALRLSDALRVQADDAIHNLMETKK